ncbi:MAG: hypothetical protein R3B60_04200 [Candidatus Paceibacterota bacterium]
MNVYTFGYFLPFWIKVIYSVIDKIVNLELRLSKTVVGVTRKVIEMPQAENILSIICLSGPIIFLPNVWSAWTAEDISSISNPSWAIMACIHLSVYIRLSHDNASSCTRISILIWMLEMIIITLAIVVR